MLLLPYSYKQMMQQQTRLLLKRVLLLSLRLMMCSSSCSNWLCRQAEAYLVRAADVLLDFDEGLLVADLQRQHLGCTCPAHYLLASATVTHLFFCNEHPSHVALSQSWPDSNKAFG